MTLHPTLNVFTESYTHTLSTPTWLGPKCFNQCIGLTVDKWLLGKQINVTKVIDKPGVLIIEMHMEMNHLV